MQAWLPCWLEGRGRALARLMPTEEAGRLSAFRAAALFPVAVARQRGEGVGS